MTRVARWLAVFVTIAAVVLGACSDEPGPSPEADAPPTPRSSAAESPTQPPAAATSPTPAPQRTSTPAPTPTAPPILEVEEIAPPDAGQIEDDLAALLDGVSELAASGTPGALCVYGPDAFPVVVGEYQGRAATVVAAGRRGQGRVVALGHEGFFQTSTLRSRDTGRLVTNALRWAAGSGSAAPRIGIADDLGLYVWLSLDGHDVAKVSLTEGALDAFDVVVVVMTDQTESQVRELAEFVSGGGGLVLGGNGWGWAHLNFGRRLATDFPGNRLLARLGMRWADAELTRTTTEGYAVAGPPGEMTHAGAALVALEDGSRPLSQAESVQAQHSVSLTAGCLPRRGALAAQIRGSSPAVTPAAAPAATPGPAGAAGATARPAPTPPPVGEVKEVTVSSSDRGELRITWTGAQPTPTDYRVMWAQQGADWPSPSDREGNVYTTSRSLTVTGLEPGARYNVAVRAREWDGSDTRSMRWGPWGPVAGTWINAAPLAPTGLTAVATHRGVVLEWDDPRDGSIRNYELVRGRHNSGAQTRLSTGGAATHYLDTDASPGTGYTYALRAINGYGEGAPSIPVNVTTLPRIPGRDDLYEQISPPVHAASVRWYWDRELDPIREMTVDFTVHNNVHDWSSRNGFYLMLLHGRISDISFYFGFQTAISHPGAPRVKGVIFSRWDTRDLDNARVAPDGWSQSAGYEGDFIGVRRAYEWGAGRYHARIAPDGLEADGEWYSVWITNRETNETTWIGSLKFPLADGAGAMSAISYSTLELYGRPTRPIDTPEWYVTITAPLADGVPPVRVLTFYPYDDNEGSAMLNSNSLFDAQEGIAYLRIGGTTERMTPTDDHDLSP